jgi:hypothetical protein
MDKSNVNFHKHMVVEKINKLEEDIGILKEILIDLQSLLIILNKKTPHRTKGYIIGDYKTYDD